MHTIRLRPGRDGPVRAGHPWIFSGAIAEGLEGIEPGTPVRVCAASGRVLGGGYANPRTPIAVRMLTLADEPVDGALVARRVDEALALRAAVLPPDLVAYRVVNGEGDRLPGMIVDRYGDWLVCQLLTAGAARLGPLLVDALVARLAPRGVYERSEGGVRAEEGIAGARGVLAGEPPPARLVIEEAGHRYLVDVEHGQKTGFFLDQRETRARLGRLAADRDVLNVFAYTGAFAIAAALGGARDGHVRGRFAAGAGAGRSGLGGERPSAGARVLRRRRRLRLAAGGQGGLRRRGARSAAVRAPPA